MLAASELSSNVPPDDVQVAPVPALLAVCPNQFSDHVPRGCFDTQPTRRSQQDAAGHELCRTPFEIGPEDLDRTIRNKLQRNAAGPGAAQENQFPPCGVAPQRYRKDAQGDSQGQENNQDIARQCEERTRHQDNFAQTRVR